VLDTRALVVRTYSGNVHSMGTAVDAQNIVGEFWTSTGIDA